MQKTIFLVDAVGFIFRSYYAITPMTNSKGASTHALYGFIRSLQKLIKDFSPDYLVAVFDGPDNSESRTQIFADYKSNRKEMPQDLGPQIGLSLEFCSLFGIPTLQIPGVEADDTIGSIAKWLSKHHHITYICSSDKDLCQLVNDHTFVLNTFKENLVLDAAKVEEIFGVKPSQIVDLLAMMGDTSDNIPGIPGFGPKTAAKLLQDFGSLDKILSNLEAIDSDKKRETLLKYQDQALISRQLAQLNFEVEFPKNLDFFSLKEQNTQALSAFYKEMHFKSLLKDMPQEAISSDADLEPISYRCVETEEELNKLFDHLHTCHAICIDTETTDLHPLNAQLVGVGFAIKEKQAFYIPCNGSLSLDKILKKLKPLLENPSIGFIGHNLKYDFHVLKNYDIEIANIYFDTMLASYLLNPQNNKHNLDLLALEMFDKKKIPIEDLIGKGKHQKSMLDVELPLITTYCCEDVDYTLRLKHRFENDLKERKLWNVFKEIELPLLPILASMERQGVFVNKEKLADMASYLNKQINSLEQAIFKECQHTFNLNSPKQLGEVLFEKMGINPPQKKGVTGYSTSASVLEELEKDYPVCKKILAYRGLEKLRSTYVESLPQQILPSTHRIHCTFNQSVTATGRLSCTDPNLQNIPTRTEEGKKIRYAFEPSKHTWSYLAADYSQIELRILAHLSQDPSLIKAFKNNEDIHKSTAALVFNVAIDDVSNEMRDMAKAVNFGILYGQQAFGLSQQLGISVQEASKFIHTYFERYPKIKSFIESCKEEARKTGFATTFTGRQRPIIDIHSKNSILKAAAERLAVNTPIQGAQADIIKMAMIKIHEAMKNDKELGFMILQIHDELIFEVPDHSLKKMTTLVQQIMETIVPLSVPLTVNVSIGKNWGEC
jgi:DNA polymerase-1